MSERTLSIKLFNFGQAYTNFSLPPKTNKKKNKKRKEKQMKSCLFSHCMICAVQFFFLLFPLCFSSTCWMDDTTLSQIFFSPVILCVSWLSLASHLWNFHKAEHRKALLFLLHNETDYIITPDNNFSKEG